MEENIISKINEVAEFVSEEDIENWIVPKLMEYYDSYLNRLSIKAYGANNSYFTKDNGDSLARAAFKEAAKKKLETAVETFIFKNEHWKTGRDIGPYLSVTLKRLSSYLYTNNVGTKLVASPVCPGCKSINIKSCLQSSIVNSIEVLSCNICNNALKTIDKEIEEYKDTCDKVFVNRLKAKRRLYKTFNIHSKAGYKCPDCGGFIPASSVPDSGNIICPYIDCGFFGDYEFLDEKCHPSCRSGRNELRLNQSIAGCDDIEIQDTLKSNDPTQDVQIKLADELNYNMELVKNIIKEQMNHVKLYNPPATMLQKTLIYEAYGNVLDKFPEEMMRYLNYKTSGNLFPLQAKILQEYVELLQDSLPYTIDCNGKKHEIVSLLDPKLSLFLGISEFDTEVCSDYSIPNKTKEVYIGGRKFKNYGPCFIGYILDVVNLNTNRSIKKNVSDYSFVQINVDNKVVPGTPVRVTHYRIPSRYEICSLVYIKDIKQKIVKKLNVYNGDK